MIAMYALFAILIFCLPLRADDAAKQLLGIGSAEEKDLKAEFAYGEALAVSLSAEPMYRCWVLIFDGYLSYSA